MPDQPTVSVSVSRKINLGNYESVDIFFSLNGVPVDWSEDDVAHLLGKAEATMDLLYPAIRNKIVEKTAEIRNPSSAGVEDWR